MKVRTSITLSRELLKAIDTCAKQQKKTRSDIIEAALWVSITQPTQNDEQNARDLEIINRQATVLNREAADILQYSLAGN